MSGKSIEHRAFRNTTLGTLSFLLTLGQTVLLVPILLKYWGNASYGLWLTLMAGYNLLQTLDLGHQNYIGNELNIVYHTDKKRFRVTLASSLLLAYLLGALELLACVAIIACGKLPILLSTSPQLIANHQASLALLLLTASWAVAGSLGGVITRILIPVGLLHYSQWLGISSRLLQFITIVAAAVSGGSILICSLSVAALQIIHTLLSLIIVRHAAPDLYPWWREANWRHALKNFQKSLLLTANAIGSQLSNNGLLILITALFSSAAIPSFTTLRTLSNTGSAVTVILISALLPDIVRFHATREGRKLDDVIQTNWFIGGLCVNFGLVLVLPVIERIYLTWTHGYLTFNVKLFLFLAASISLTNFGAGMTQYLAGINDLHAQLTLTLIRAGSLMSCSLILCRYFGLVGVGLASVIAELLASVILPIWFTNSHLAPLSVRLSRRHIRIALVPPSLLVMASIILMTTAIRLVFLTSIITPVLIIVYWANWRLLRTEVRGRLLALLSSMSNVAPRFRKS